MHKSKTIGILEATKETTENKVIYTNHTNIETRILTQIKLEYSYNVTYANRTLQAAEVSIFLNNKSRTQTKTEQKKNGYAFYKDEELDAFIKQTISYSTLNLLFEEPVNIQHVYAEEHGEFHSLCKISAHTYTKTTPKGKVSTYIYNNGKLTEATIDVGFISFKIMAM